MAGGGGLLRDQDGRWISGFSFKLGTCSVLVAELWAILHGLRLAWEKGVRKLTVETDSLVTLKGIKNRHHANNKHNTIYTSGFAKPGLDSEVEACLQRKQQGCRCIRKPLHEERNWRIQRVELPTEGDQNHFAARPLANPLVKKGEM